MVKHRAKVSYRPHSITTKTVSVNVLVSAPLGTQMGTKSPHAVSISNITLHAVCNLISPNPTFVTLL